jgi:3-oxoacyl-[acyl-carrier protein] reductase
MPQPVAVITGAAKGIGFETARRLVPTHRVAALDRDRADVERAAAELGGEVLALPCDIVDGASVASAIGAVIERWGSIEGQRLATGWARGSETGSSIARV